MRNRRDALLTAVHITGLWAILAAHPLLDVVGRSPEFFVAHRAEPAEILGMLAALLVGAPILLVGVLWAARIAGRRGRTVTAGAMLSVLLAAAATQTLMGLGANTWTAAGLPAAALGIAITVLYFHSGQVRQFFTFLSVGAIFVPIVFLAKPGIAALLPSAPRPALSTGWREPAVSLPPVVLIVFDEMPLASLLDRDRMIDARRLPHLAALARDGVWFRNATTVSDYTPWAVPSILTGQWPAARKAPSFRSYPNTLFTFLSRTHRLDVMESLTRLCPRELCSEAQDPPAVRLMSIARDLALVAAHVFVPPDLHDRFDIPELSGKWAGGLAGPPTSRNSTAGDRRRPRREGYGDRRRIVDAFIERIEPQGTQPAFYFFHPPLPHEPWMLLPGGQRNATLAPLPSAVYPDGPLDEWEIVQNQQRHLLQVGYADHALGRIVRRLAATGLYDRALVVITADHGVAIASGRHARDFSPENAGEIMRVPLIVKPPDVFRIPDGIVQMTQTGMRISDRNVETIDIAPTVSHVLGQSLPWNAAGSSVFDPRAEARPQKQIWSESASKVHRYGAEGPSVDAVLQDRQRTFGDGNVYSIPRPPKFGELVGRHVADLPQTGGRVEGALAFGRRYASVAPEADAIPFDVGGVLRGEASADPVYLAVSVNGVIRAVTRTWTTKPGWLATPPLEVWRRGENDVGVYLVRDSGRGPSLTVVRTAPPPNLNLISGDAARFWGVRREGFYRSEGRGERAFRWTRANASVAVPLDGPPPTALHLSIARGGQRSTRLIVTVNGCQVYDGVVPRDWIVTLPLAACDLAGDELVVELRSAAVQPKEGSRVLGVAVRSLSLQTPGEPVRDSR